MRFIQQSRVIFATFFFSLGWFSQYAVHRFFSKEDNANIIIIEDEDLAGSAIHETLENVTPSSNSNDDIQEVDRTLQKVIHNQFRISNLTEFREWSIRKEREVLGDEMTNYHFEDNKKLKDLVLEEDGKPIRNIIVSTWRSGSTFVGAIIHSHPGTYYHFEPLQPYGDVQMHSGDLAEQGLQDLRELLNCRYTNLTNDYMKRSKENYYFINNMNPRVGRFCENHQVCWNSSFLDRMCRLFPFQVMKTVRMRLTPAKTLLDDRDLDIRILLLIRDPRGVIQSRSRIAVCAVPDCESPRNLCSDMEADFHETIELRRKYPDRFMALRYEDISLNPYSAAKKLSKFFRLQYHPNVERFLDTHTTQRRSGVLGVSRDSKTAPFHWREDFADNFNEVKRIQSHCEQAMDMWGYRIANDKSEMMAFNPVNKPPWDEMKIPEEDERA